MNHFFRGFKGKQSLFHKFINSCLQKVHYHAGKYKLKQRCIVKVSLDKMTFDMSKNLNQSELCPTLSL